MKRTAPAFPRRISPGFSSASIARTARDRSGFGLGLAIAKWIAELHGGAITVKSSLGHGTTFEVMLPFYE